MSNSSENIDLLYTRIQERARRIVARFPAPSFYIVHQKEFLVSRAFFETNPVIVKVRGLLDPCLKGAMGHGRKHALKVTVDAGALMLIEGKRAGYGEKFLERRLLLVQSAGMLHDACRRQEEHAVKGAEHARAFLKRFSFHPGEIEDVACAIRNHEAFKKLVKINTPEGGLLSDCLYDADKFRWGPDNFTDTVWDMVRHFHTPLEKFMEYYPKGIELIERIKATFRTASGKVHGPEIIDLGLDIGREVFRMIKTDFAVHLKQ